MSAWGWPQWVMAALMLVQAVLNVIGHTAKGQPRTAFFAPFASALIAWVLWMGGFWG